MSSTKKSEAPSVIQTASELVAKWSDSKKAAFEQRTGLRLGRKSQDGRQESSGVRPETIRKKEK